MGHISWEAILRRWRREVVKSQAWIGYKSKSLAGENVTFDTGANWGMSPRTLAMLGPYKDVVRTFGVV